MEGEKDVSFEIIEMTFLGATGQNGTYVWWCMTHLLFWFHAWLTIKNRLDPAKTLKRIEEEEGGPRRRAGGRIWRGRQRLGQYQSSWHSCIWFKPWLRGSSHLQDGVVRGRFGAEPSQKQEQAWVLRTRNRWISETSWDNLTGRIRALVHLCSGGVPGTLAYGSLAPMGFLLIPACW